MGLGNENIPASKIINKYIYPYSKPSFHSEQTEKLPKRLI